MNPRNFFAELKRRNVYKVAVAYAVIAWLLIQAASILFPTFEAPGWVMKVFITAIVLGFPGAPTRRSGVGRLARYASVAHLPGPAAQRAALPENSRVLAPKENAD